LKVLTLGIPYFFDDAREFGFEIFKIRTGNKQADILLPRSVYDASDLLAKARTRGFNPDIIFLGDESSPPWVYGLEKLDIPVVWYAVDTHIHHSWHINYCAAFDVIFMAQKGYEKLFSVCNKHGILSFTPLFSNNITFDKPGTHTRGAVFVGNLDPEIHRERNVFFSELAKITDIELRTGSYLPYYRSAKIVLNHSSHIEINFRVFEALHSGAMLITDNAYGQEYLFTDKKHLAVFDPHNVKQAADLISYYMENEGKRKLIADAGQKLIFEKHTRRLRMQQVADFLKQTDLDRLVVERQERQEEISALIKQAFMYWSEHELLKEKERGLFSNVVDTYSH